MTTKHIERVELILSKLKKVLLENEFEIVEEFDFKCGPEDIFEDDDYKKCTITFRTIGPVKWIPPKWLKEGSWIAMQQNGCWLLYKKKPELKHNSWVATSKDVIRLDPELQDFDPPPYTDWKQSLRQIKHEE